MSKRRKRSSSARKAEITTIEETAQELKLKRRKSNSDIEDELTPRIEKKEKKKEIEEIEIQSINDTKGTKVTITNKLKETIFVGIYYKWRIGWGDAKRSSDCTSILSGERISLVKPPIRTDRTRKLVMSFQESEILEKLSCKALSLLQIAGIDFDDDIVIDYDKDGNDAVFFKGYNSIQYRRKRTRRSLTNSMQRLSGSYDIKLLKRALSGSTPSSPLVEPREIDDIVVTCRNELDIHENEYLNARFMKSKKAIESLLDMEEGSLGEECTPRIAFCGSGGGARAMLCTIGALQGLDDINVIDCLTYAAGLSGSTWALSVWEGLNLSTNELAENVKYKFEHGHMIVPTAPVIPEWKEIVKSKFIYNHSKVNFVNDIYAAQLSVHLLRDSVPPTTKFVLSDFRKTANLSEGKYPFPIFVSALQEPSTEYQWFEFTPYTIGCSEYDCFIPSELFGRKFCSGKLRKNNEKSVEICLAYLLATFASAFCAPWRRVADEFFEKMEVQPISLLSENLTEYREGFSGLLMKLKLSENHALEPPQFRNFMYGLHRSPVRKLKYIPLVDAGIDFNLPFPPLLEPLRNIDIIIASNASRTPEIAENYSLKCIMKYAARKHLKFPIIDFEKEEEIDDKGNPQLIYQKPVSLFKDDNDPNCPIIIYLPLSKNEDYNSNFDPQENARVGGYCGTFNFDIKPHQFEELTGLTRYTASLAKDKIIEAIKLKIQQKSNKDYNNAGRA